MSIIKFLSFRVVLMMTIFVFIFVLLSAYISYLKFQQDAEYIKTNYLVVEKEKLKVEVRHYADFINSEKEKSLDNYKKDISQRVNEAHTIASKIYTLYKDTKSEDEIKTIIIETLRQIKFNDGNGYYFIFDLDGVERLFTDKPELEGVNMLGLKNHDGVYVVQEMLKLIQKNSSGFYNYKWTRPNRGDKQFEKVSYLKLLAELDWVIGTGAYKVDIEKLSKLYVIEKIEEMGHISRSKNHLFIGDWQGVSQTYPVKGKNMLHVKDKNGLFIVKELIKTAKNGGGFIQYVMPIVDEKIKSSLKLSYVEPISDWNWYVGHVVYIKDIDSKVSSLKNGMYKDSKKNIFIVLVTAVFILIIFLFINKSFYKRINKDLVEVEEFLDSVVRENKEIDRTKITFQEFDHIAKSGNAMLEKKIELEKELEHLAQHDALTKLPNRILLLDRLNRSILSADRNKKIFAVCFLDLDNFKYINDTLGHDGGDHALVEFSIRLKNTLREVDTTSRVGGDEFIIILEDLNTKEEVEIAITKVLKSLNVPILVDGKIVNLFASIGISLYPQDGKDAHNLIKNADNAMYKAKKSGKNKREFYT